MQQLDGAVTVCHSILEGGWNDDCDSTVIDDNPLFISASQNNFRIACESPAFDAGDDNAVALDEHDVDEDQDDEEIAPDLDSISRIADKAVDMGAYEGGGGYLCCPADLAPPGGDDLVNVDDLVVLLGSWGPCSCPADFVPRCTGDGQVNVDDLVILLGSWGPCPPCDSFTEGNGPSPGEPSNPPSVAHIASCLQACAAYAFDLETWIACLQECLGE